jgi:hypothetical protein
MSKTNTGLVEYAEAQLGRPYWMGTFGQTATKALYDSNRSRLPGDYAWTDMPTQFGKRVHDCIGLIKGYCWSDGPDSPPVYASNGFPDISADGMKAACRIKGPICTIPDIPGLLVFAPGHVGVYAGGGYVIEAMGHKYGVVKTRLKDRTFTTWGQCPYITYDQEAKKVDKLHDENGRDNIPNSWGREAVEWAEKNEILFGNDSGDLLLRTPMTREMGITFLYRLYKLLQK